MKGFIKIKDVGDKVHYININHIIKFTNGDIRLKANTAIRIIGGDNTATIQTESTVEEVAEMVKLANE